MRCLEALEDRGQPASPAPMIEPSTSAREPPNGSTSGRGPFSDLPRPPPLTSPDFAHRFSDRSPTSGWPKSRIATPVGSPPRSTRRASLGRGSQQSVWVCWLKLQCTWNSVLHGTSWNMAIRVIEVGFVLGHLYQSGNTPLFLN